MNKVRQRIFNRRNFLGTFGAGMGAAAYMRFGEAEWLEVNERGLDWQDAGSTRRPAEGFTILHLSDFHASPVVSLEYLAEAVALGVGLRPNLICLTGDFITSKYGQFEEYGAIFKKLSEAAPAFACMGNHDGGSWVRRHGYADWSLVGGMLQGAGVTVLHNTSRAITLKGRELQLVGLGDLWSKEMDPRKAFAGVRRDLRTILLSHNPDSKEYLGDFPWDLMLSGHTHGGQLALPVVGTPFAPVLDHRYVAGMCAWQDRWIHITKGVGNLHGMRFNCRPEVSLVKVSV